MSQFPWQPLPPNASRGALYSPFSPPKRGLPAWAIVVIVLIVIGAVLVVGVVLLLMWLGMNAPPMEVLSGRQIPAEEQRIIDDLGLLEPGEQLVYFYTDGAFDATEGMYMLTDRALLSYSDMWAQPSVRVPFEQMYALDVHYDPSFFTDSTIFVSWVDGAGVELHLSVPVTSDGGGDKRFYEELRRRWQAANPEPGSE